MNDILLNQTFDPVIRNGDFATGDSDAQHQFLLLMTGKGDWKQNPSSGVALETFLSDDDVDGMFRSIREQFTADGMTVNSLGFSKDGQLLTDAKY